jgi:hypothetical protein
MRTGTLGIRRGHQIGDDLPASPRLSVVPRCAEPPMPDAADQPPPPRLGSPEYHAIHDRLTALERLARLFEQGALTQAEFAAEKAALLSVPADELILVEPVAASPAVPAAIPPRRPSLLGRLFAWRLVPVALAAGLLFSFASQPQETMRFFDEALRLLGA